MLKAYYGIQDEINIDEIEEYIIFCYAIKIIKRKKNNKIITRVYVWILVIVIRKLSHD